MNQNFGLSTHMQEEVNVMCNLSEAVEERAVEKTAQYSQLPIELVEEIKRTMDARE